MERVESNEASDRISNQDESGGNCAAAGEPGEAVLETLLKMYTAYGKLHDRVSDMVEDGRLTEADFPGDYPVVVALLAGDCMTAINQAAERLREAGILPPDGED